MMKIVALEADTLGTDVDFSCIERFGELEVYRHTLQEELTERIEDADIIIVNKLKLNRDNLSGAKNLKLICETATGYDNIDVNYCWRREIGVCNVRGYSTDSVVQVTFAMALSLISHIREYNRYVRQGKYTASGAPMCIEPTYHELCGMVWGIVGYGEIGSRVAKIASAFGCEVMVYNRSKRAMPYEQTELDTLLKKSDIVSLHVPLTEETKYLINEKNISLMKESAALLNMARGAVLSAEAAVNAVLNKKIAALGVDVYEREPLDLKSAYNAVVGLDNVILTPHMAWGAYEARVRCLEEVAKNIDTFIMGGKRNRVDL